MRTTRKHLDVVIEARFPRNPKSCHARKHGVPRYNPDDVKEILQQFASTFPVRGINRPDADTIAKIERFLDLGFEGEITLQCRNYHRLSVSARMLTDWDLPDKNDTVDFIAYW